MDKSDPIAVLRQEQLHRQADLLQLRDMLEHDHPGEALAYIRNTLAWMAADALRDGHGDAPLG